MRRSCFTCAACETKAQRREMKQTHKQMEWRCKKVIIDFTMVKMSNRLIVRLWDNAEKIRVNDT